MSYDAAMTEAADDPLGISGAGRTLQSYPNFMLLNSRISASLRRNNLGEGKFVLPRAIPRAGQHCGASTIAVPRSWGIDGKA